MKKSKEVRCLWCNKVIKNYKGIIQDKNYYDSNGLCKANIIKLRREELRESLDS